MPHQIDISPQEPSCPGGLSRPAGLVLALVRALSSFIHCTALAAFIHCTALAALCSTCNTCAANVTSTTQSQNLSSWDQAARGDANNAGTMGATCLNSTLSMAASSQQNDIGNAWLDQASLRQSPTAIGPQGGYHVGHPSCTSKLAQEVWDRWGPHAIHHKKPHGRKLTEGT